jgi:threonine dehydrogenase-like Zn-dependent dehydrogenase
VAGTGAIGILAAFVLRTLGWDVTSVDRHDDSTAPARLLRRIDARHANVRDGWGDLDGGTYDVIVEASGNAALDLELVGRLGPNGVLVLTGIPGATAPPVSVAAGALLRNVVLENLAVVGSVNANRSYFETGIGHLGEFRARWGDAIEQVITERRPWTEAPTLLGTAGGPGMKTVLTVAGV